MGFRFTPFRQMRRLLGVRWLTEGDGELVGYSLDIVKDAFAERARRGLLARFPQNGPDGETAPSDALAAMGRDRRVVRGFNESSSSYAKRLIAWLDDRKTAGNPYALMQKVAEYLGTDIGLVLKTVDNSGNWFVRAADGTRSFHLKEGNWDWDASPASWSRFWLIVHPPTGSPTGATYGGGDNWGEVTGTWGSSALLTQVQSVRSIIADWKPAGTKCQNIIIAFDPDSFDPVAAAGSSGLPDGLWGHWSKLVGGVQVPARLSTARYWDGS